MIESATKDKQSITADCVFTQDLIEGVRVREVKNVPKANGLLTEISRRNSALEGGTVDQVFQVTLFPGAVFAWHVHQLTTDRLFVNHGQIKVVLHDALEARSHRLWTLLTFEVWLRTLPQWPRYPRSERRPGPIALMRSRQEGGRG